MKLCVLIRVNIELNTVTSSSFRLTNRNFIDDYSFRRMLDKQLLFLDSLCIGFFALTMPYAAFYRYRTNKKINIAFDGAIYAIWIFNRSFLYDRLFHLEFEKISNKEMNLSNDCECYSIILSD